MASLRTETKRQGVHLHPTASITSYKEIHVTENAHNTAGSFAIPEGMVVYYLRVLKQVYVRDSDGGAVATPLLTRSVVGLIALLVVAFGFYPDLLLNWIGTALATIPH